MKLKKSRTKPCSVTTPMNDLYQEAMENCLDRLKGRVVYKEADLEEKPVLIVDAALIKQGPGPHDPGWIVVKLLENEEVYNLDFASWQDFKRVFKDVEEWRSTLEQRKDNKRVHDELLRVTMARDAGTIR
jgi:hypothetical protein